MLLSKLKVWGLAIGAGLMTFLAFAVRMQSLKNQRDKAVQERDHAKAKLHVSTVEKKLSKEKEENLSSSLEEVERIEEKGKKGEGFEGFKNLSNPNDF